MLCLSIMVNRINHRWDCFNWHLWDFDTRVNINFHIFLFRCQIKNDNCGTRSLQISMKCSILDKDLFETEMCEKQNKTCFKLVSRLGDSVVYFDQLLGVRSTQKLKKYWRIWLAETVLCQNSGLRSDGSQTSTHNLIYRDEPPWSTDSYNQLWIFPN